MGWTYIFHGLCCPRKQGLLAACGWGRSRVARLTGLTACRPLRHRRVAEGRKWHFCFQNAGFSYVYVRACKSNRLKILVAK
ncbi:hypothetical protein [Brucella melitensis]|uniref:hypothetical protein n=1 Tax=Brucella melitensis TaxID=29459 RepID=UPI000F8CC46A|nr:hypothetical protein [Brucella melitensis]